jgi:hypothetical protein
MSNEKTESLTYKSEVTVIQRRDGASCGILSHFKLDPAQALADKSRVAELAEKFAAENAEFIAEYNERVEKEGTSLQEYRSF